MKKDKVYANEPVYIRYMLQGFGDLRGFKFDFDLPDGCKIFSDKPNIQTKIEQNRLISSYFLDFALSCQRSVLVTFPTFSYFDTKKMKFQKLL
ncbi:MAG: hypothetical protein HXX81_04705 [Campylobacterales bacterium]|nr:hypothetical protein [Campylobacterales bacterium]